MLQNLNSQNVTPQNLINIEWLYIVATTKNKINQSVYNRAFTRKYKILAWILYHSCHDRLWASAQGIYQYTSEEEATKRFSISQLEAGGRLKWTEAHALWSLRDYNLGSTELTNNYIHASKHKTRL